MRTILRVLLLTGVAAFATTMMKGQQTAATPFDTSHQEVDLALTYAALHSNLTTGTNFWQQGGTVELSAEVYRGLGVVANIAGGRASNINDTGGEPDDGHNHLRPTLYMVAKASQARSFRAGTYRRSARSGQHLSVDNGRNNRFQCVCAPDRRRLRSPPLASLCCSPHRGGLATHPVPKRNDERAEQSSP